MPTRQQAAQYVCTLSTAGSTVRVHMLDAISATVCAHSGSGCRGVSQHPAPPGRSAALLLLRLAAQMHLVDSISLLPNSSPPPLHPTKPHPLRTGHFIASSDKAKRELGWKPRHDFLSDVSSLVREYTSSGRQNKDIDFSIDDKILSALRVPVSSGSRW